MINDIGSTLIQLGEKPNVWENSKKPTEPCADHKQAAEVPAHDGCIMQGLADGNIAVIGQGS